MRLSAQSRRCAPVSENGLAKGVAGLVSTPTSVVTAEAYTATPRGGPRETSSANTPLAELNEEGLAVLRCVIDVPLARDRSSPLASGITRQSRQSCCRRDRPQRSHHRDPHQRSRAAQAVAGKAANNFLQTKDQSFCGSPVRQLPQTRPDD